MSRRRRKKSSSRGSGSNVVLTVEILFVVLGLALLIGLVWVVNTVRLRF